MAEIVLGLVVSIAANAGAALVSSVFAPKPKPVVRGKLEGDLNLQSSEYGQIIPIVYGANPTDNKGGGITLAGNVIWTSGVTKTTETTSGGKGPRQPDIETISYFIDLAILIGEGPLKVTKIWANTELIYDIDESEGATGQSGIYDDTEPPDDDYDQFLPPDPLGEYSTSRYDGTATPDGDGVVSIVSSAGNYSSITIYPGNELQQADPLIQADVDGRKGAGSTPAYRGRCYVVFEKYNLSKFGGVVPNFTFQVENTQLKTLDTICSDVCRRAGLSAMDYGFDNLAGIASRGFVINSRQAPRAVLELLGRVYNVEFFESDGVIQGTVLGSEPVAAIPAADLGAMEGGPRGETSESEPLIDSTLLDEPQIPYQVEIKFFDAKRDGQSNTQRENRQVVRSEKIESIDVPACLIPKEARRMAQRELYQAWLERNTFAFQVPWKYAYLKPTDVVSITKGGFTYSVRIKEISGTLPSPLAITGVAQEVSIYDPAGDAGSGDGYDPFAVDTPAPSVATLFSLPFLRPGDSGLGYYAACAARAVGKWPSAALFKDLGLGFEKIADFPQQATMGVAVGLLGTHTGANPDTTNTLTVDLYFGALESASTADVEAGANLAIIGNELIQWETAVQVAGFPRRYTLSNLRRGVKMTNLAIPTHVAGERFAVINSAIIFVATFADEAGVQRSYKAVTAGQTVDDAAAFTFTWEGNPNSADTDSGPPNPAKITSGRVVSKRRLPDDKILVQLEILCPGRFTDPGANMSRVDAAFVSVIDKFGSEILAAQAIPFSGDGVLPALTHARKNAEPTGFTANQPPEVNLPEATYRVQLRNRFGLSDPFFIRGVTLSLTTPTYLAKTTDHPQNLVAVALSETQVQLAWSYTGSNPALIAWYKIPTDNTPSGAYAGDTAGLVTAYTVNNLLPNTNYDFRVDVNGKYSNITAVKTFEGATNAAFPAPTGLVVTENYTNRVRIEWDYLDGSFSAVEVWRDSTLLFTDSVNPASGDGFSDFYADHTVVGNTTYVFKVRYVYGTNASDFTTVSTTTPAATYSPPEIKTTSPDSGPAGDTRTRLMLRDLVDGNTGGVEIYRNGVLLTTLTDLPSGVDGYYFNDSSLNPNTAYTYKARNKYPSSNYSAFTPDFVITTTNVGSNVTTPTTFTVTGTTETTISLSWVNPGTTPTQWRIYVNGVFKTTVTGSSTTTTLTALLPDTTYSIAIIARYGGDYSHFASLTSSTGTNTSYPAPTSLSATPISISQINLSWTRNSSTNTGVEVWRFNPATGAFELFTTLLATATSYSNTGLTANTLYRYKIRHVYAGGVFSNFTAEASATTTAVTYLAPSALSATPASSTQINLAWTRNAGDNTAVEVWRNGSLLTTLGAAVVSFNDTNLTPNTVYSYQVRNKFSGPNYSAYSNTAQATTQSGTVFPAPSGLVATATSSTAIAISWTRNTTANTNVKLYRNGFLLATLSAATTSYTDTTVSPSTSYTYKTRNVFTTGESADSNESTATTPASVSYPPPSGLGATAVSDSQINLSWTRNATDNTGVEVWRLVSLGIYSLHATLAGNVTTYSDTGLNPSTSYTYYVRNTFPGGNASTNSSTASATTSAAPTYPAPSSLIATGTPGQVALTWTRNATTNTGVEVRRSEINGQNEVVLTTLGAAVVNYTDTTGTPGVVYYYRVRNVFTGPVYSAFAESGAIIFPSAFPAPSNLVATAPTTSGVNLTWVRNTTSNTETRIIRTGGLDFPLYIVAATATSYTDTNVLPNQTYTYQVQHLYGSTFSAYSNAATVTVPNGPLPIPVNFTGQATSGSTIALAWTRTNTANTGWELWRNGAFLTNLPAGDTSYTDTGLTPSTSYTYKLRATYASGNSEFTPEITIMTGPPDFPAPKNLRVTNVSNFSVSLAWGRNSSTNTKTQIHRKTGAGGTYAQIADVEGATTSYVDSTVASGTTYYYKVRNRYSGGDLSEFSNEVQVTTL